jgi:phosphate/sulfate permease
MVYLERLRTHFDNWSGHYCAIGTVATVAFTINAKWGTPAALCFALTSVIGGFYLSQHVEILSRLNAHVSTWGVVAIAVLSFFSPLAGGCLTVFVLKLSIEREKEWAQLLEKGSKHVVQVAKDTASFDAIGDSLDESAKMFTQMKRFTQEVIQHVPGVDAQKTLQAQLAKFYSTGSFGYEKSDDMIKGVQDVTAVCNNHLGEIRAMIEETKAEDRELKNFLASIKAKKEATKK